MKKKQRKKNQRMENKRKKNERKENKRKKNKGNRGTPQATKAPTAPPQVNIISFDRHLKRVPGEASEPPGLQLLRDAHAILAADKKGNGAPFYGTEWLQALDAGKIIDDTVVRKVVFVGLDAGFAQQAEELRKIVEELRGSCCYKVEEPLQPTAPRQGETHRKKQRRQKNKGLDPRYMFVKEGIPQFWLQGSTKGMLVTETFEDAVKFVAYMKDNRGEEMNIVRMDRKTVDACFVAMVADGADCMLMVRFDGDEVTLQPFRSTHWRIPLGDRLWTDKDHPIPIDALFDESTGPNLSKDPRKALADAQVIFGVDVMSQREFLVYGKEVLDQIIESGTPQRLYTIWVAVDMETHELEKLVALVQVVKGHDDYQAG